MCMYCGNKEVETTISPNTKELNQEKNSDFRKQTITFIFSMIAFGVSSFTSLAILKLY